MVARYRKVQTPEAEAFLGLKEPSYPPAAVLGKLEKKFLFVAPVCEMPDIAGNVIAVSSGHGCTIYDVFGPKKAQNWGKNRGKS